jgi:hypothetical protein
MLKNKKLRIKLMVRNKKVMVTDKDKLSKQVRVMRKLVKMILKLKWVMIVEMVMMVKNLMRMVIVELPKKVRV